METSEGGRIGIMLTEEGTSKLLELAMASGEEPFTIIEGAIATMYKIYLGGVVSEYGGQPPR